MIGSKFNMEDVFFRDLTTCVLDTLEGQIRWVNRFTSGDVPVNVPFYYSLTGDERFLLDAFVDDVVSENRFVELNTDQIPRGHITMNSFNIDSDEFANPNVWLRMVVENEKEIKKVLTRVRAVPITVNYDLQILLSSEIDIFKCSQAIMDTLWLHKFMYFEHNFMNIDAVINMPDANQIEIQREKNLTSDNTIKMTVSFEVKTYYPAFRKDRMTAFGYTGADGMTDMNGHIINGGFSSYFNTPYDYIGGLDPNIGRPASPNTTDQDYFIYSPKRTRWFNNILKARQKSNYLISIPSSDDGRPTKPVVPETPGTLKIVNSIGDEITIKTINPGSNEEFEVPDTTIIILDDDGTQIGIESVPSASTTTIMVTPGGIKGSGEVGELAFFNGTQSITSDSSFSWNGDSLTILGDVLSGEEGAVFLSTTKKVDLDTVGTFIIYQIDSSLYDSAFFDYVIKGNGSIRSGNIYSAWVNNQVTFSEYSNTGVGDTSGLVFQVISDSGFINLIVSVSTPGWELKTIIKTI
jgi:hypothetical protein